MHNNDTLARLRIALNYSNEQLSELAALSGGTIDRAGIGARLCKPDSEGHVACSDAELAQILDGLIVRLRGPREGEALDYSAIRLNNSAVLKKLRIAFNLKEAEMLATFAAGGIELGPREMGAFFRKPDNKHFRPCHDKQLRAFLKGLVQHAPS